MKQYKHALRIQWHTPQKKKQKQKHVRSEGKKNKKKIEIQEETRCFLVFEPCLSCIKMVRIEGTNRLEILVP